MTDPIDRWVVRDTRALDPDALKRAIEAQASLGELITRLRSVRYPEVPVPDDREGIVP